MAKTAMITALVAVVLAACGEDTAATTTSSTTSTSVISPTLPEATTTTGDDTTPTGATTTTTQASPPTTLAPGPFGSSVATEGITAQLSYSLETPLDICTGLDEGIAAIEFQDGPLTSIGGVIFICFPGFEGFEEVTITPPGGGGVQAPLDGPRDGSKFVMWTVLPGDATGDYSVAATPGEEGDPIIRTFTVSQATTPGLRVVEPAVARWLQPEWPGRGDVLGEIFLAYFGLQSEDTFAIDIYGDPEIGEVAADYVGTLVVTVEAGGAGILRLTSAGEEGFYCFSIRSPTQTCDAAVQLLQ